MLPVIETSLSVRCRYCEKFIRVPSSVAEKASNDTSDTELRQLSSQTFMLRCHYCEKESVYSSNQIVLVPAAPPEHAQPQ